jgi:hypothetical protein
MAATGWGLSHSRLDRDESAPGRQIAAWRVIVGNGMGGAGAVGRDYAMLPAPRLTVEHLRALSSPEHARVSLIPAG